MGPNTICCGHLSQVHTPMHFYIFGGELRRLGPSDSLLVAPGNDMYPLARKWCKLAGTDLANSTGIIPQLRELSGDELRPEKWGKLSNRLERISIFQLDLCSTTNPSSFPQIRAAVSSRISQYSTKEKWFHLPLLTAFQESQNPPPA